MSLSNKGIGARIRFSVGRKGQPQTMINARIVGPAELVIAPGKAPAFYADVVQHKQTLDGLWILNARTQNLNYAFDRTERVEALDGTPDSPKSANEVIAEASAMLEAFLMGGGSAASQTVALDELPA